MIGVALADFNKNRHNSGSNICYGDGHVGWKNTTDIVALGAQSLKSISGTNGSAAWQGK
jgi:prepilin-type processing-associated H-X9-DG protein